MKKSILTHILMSFARGYYSIISFLAYLSRGNKALIAKKIKTGAYIISQIALMSCNNTPEKGPITCYVEVPDDKIIDSIEKVRKQDSLLKVQKEHQDSMMRNVTCYAKPCDNPNKK